MQKREGEGGIGRKLRLQALSGSRGRRSRVVATLQEELESLVRKPERETPLGPTAQGRRTEGKTHQQSALLGMLARIRGVIPRAKPATPCRSRMIRNASPIPRAFRIVASSEDPRVWRRGLADVQRSRDGCCDGSSDAPCGDVGDRGVDAGGVERVPAKAKRQYEPAEENRGAAHLRYS